MTKSDKAKFFKELAIEFRLSDLKEVERLYYCFVRYFGRNIKLHQIVEFPEWGAFKVYELKGRLQHIPSKGCKQQVGSRKGIKFTTYYKLKKHLNNLNN